jgi:hypothetical protein
MQASPPPSAQVLPETAPEAGAKAPPKASAKAPPEASAKAPPKATHAGLAGARPWAAPIAAGPAMAVDPWEPKPAHVKPSEPIEEDREPAASAPVPPETEQTVPMPRMSDTPFAEATVIPRRPVIEDTGRSRADVPWLGIASWLLLCGALFTSLVGWPDQTALDRVSSIWPDGLTITTLTRGPAEQEQEPVPPPATPDPAQGQDWSAMTPGPANQREALPPTELAPPIRSDAPPDTAEPAAQRPPLPRFKPNVDRVAAQFSNAFFEFGDQLQQQGNLDAAVHMRRQGTNLNPWKVTGASDL